MADVPPALTLELPKKSDLPNTFKPWNEVHLPIDILLLTVDDCEFLACYAYLRNSFKSYLKNLGYVYFGNMGENGDVPLKVALMTCSEGSSAPDGSLVTVKNAVVELRPKAVFYVGCCGGLNPEVTKLQLGDVVVSSKLTTESFKTPVSRDILLLVRPADHGWIPPLRNPEDHKVQVCCNGEILSGINPVSAKQQNVSHFTEATALAFGGEGLFAAAHDLKIEWVIVKGISHFADGNNPAENSWESHACIMAASLVSNMLKDPFVFEQWPHYEDASARKQPSSPAATKEELPDSRCLEECQKQLRSIYETNSTVKIVPWDQSSAVHIDKVYTQLSWLMDEKDPSGVTQKKLQHYTDIFDGGRLHHTPKRILVHGRPGIGKTVFTQKATFDWSQHRFEGKLGRFDLALLVNLRDVCNLNDVPAILNDANLLASDGPVSTDNLYDYVRRHQENVLLILDGYDEYVHSAERQSPVLKIWEKKQLRDCCVIITSRDMKGEGLKSSSDAQFEIKGFDRKRQEEFARRFLKDDQDVEEFFEYLVQQDLKDVAKIPILLLMLLLVWKEKDREGLPSSRVMVYFEFLQTMFNHMSEKQKMPAEKVDDHIPELCKVGELAFDALLQDLLYFPLSKLPDPVLTEKLIEVGLFQLLNMSALNPCKAVHFIHKSMQEFLASLFLKEKLLSQESKNNSLFKVDSIKKIFKLNEVFKFVAEMSEEAARDILIHLLEMAAKEDGAYSFDNQAPSVKDLSETQKNLLTLCTQLFFYCSSDTRTELFPNFLSNLGGVLFILNPDQLNIAAKENFVKTTASLMYIFFSESRQYTEQSYNNLISLVQQLNAVIVSKTGEQKASEFLNVFPWRSVDEFFLMKEENNTHLYFAQIVKQTSNNIPLPFKMVKTLVSLEETTKKTNMNGDESSEESSSSCCSKRHGLSRVRWIEAWDVNRSDVEQLIEMMPFITALDVISVLGKGGEVFDAEVTESLLRSIPTTHELERLTLWNINVTSSPAVEFISRVFKQDLPNLKWLDMSFNPLLGAGVDSLIKHLSCAPHLEILNLLGVKMTPQQVMDLSSAIKQHGNITELESFYHEPNGDPRPEYEWPSEDDWSESEDDQEQILEETHPSVHGSPFLAHDPDTVGTFQVPFNPAAGVVLAEASSPAEHGSSHGQTSFSGYLPPHYDSQHHSSPDIQNHHHNTPSTIFTPGRSWRYPYPSGSGLSTVTQGEPHLECLFVNETAAALQRNTRPSTHDSPLPVYGQDTVRPFPLPHYRAVEVPISVAHGFSEDTSLFSTHHHSAPSTIFTPGWSLGSEPYPGGSGMSTFTHPPQMQEFCSPYGTLRRPLYGLQPQTTFNSGLGVSTITHPLRIQEAPRPSLHGLQHQSTIPDVPNLAGYGLSTDTLQPQIPELHASYGTPSPSLRGLQPHHTFPEASYLSGCGLSTVTHLPGLSGRSSQFGTIRPPQYELQSQSAIPGDPHLSDSATSSVTHPSVIRFPWDGTLRPQMYGTQLQSVIPGDLHRSGPFASSFTHRPVIPGRFSPYGTLRSHPPSSQSRISFMSGQEQNADDETDRP